MIVNNYVLALKHNEQAACFQRLDQLSHGIHSVPLENYLKDAEKNWELVDQFINQIGYHFAFINDYMLCQTWTHVRVFVKTCLIKRVSTDCSYIFFIHICKLFKIIKAATQLLEVLKLCALFFRGHFEYCLTLEL